MTPNIPREVHVGLFQVINKSRMLNGWKSKTAAELDATIRSWAEIFVEYKIPVSAYDSLYKRGFDVRQKALRNGKDVPQMDATLLVSQWTGEHGLAAELRQKEVDAKRYLPAAAESACERCFGTGWECTDRGARRCDHANSTEAVA